MLPHYTFTFLSVIGGLTIIVLVGLIIVFAVQALLELARRLKRNYIIKHRFDKPPVARCYCKDCRYHKEDDECAVLGGWRTADNWFCWRAEPEKNIGSL